MSLAAPLASSAPAQTRASPASFEAAPLILALATLALGAFAPAVLGDGDTWSHVATGDWILDHRRSSRRSVTFTFSGAPGPRRLAFRGIARARPPGGGWGGVMLLTGAAAATAVYVVGRRVERDLTGVAVLVVMVMSLALIAPGLLARPHLLALPVMAIWCDALLSARERGVPPPAMLAVVMALWANLHGGFIFGLGLIAPFAIEAFIGAPAEQRLETGRGWVLFGLASLVAALVTPLGGEGLVFPFKLMNNPELANISEWRAADFSHPGGLEVTLFALFALALTRPFISRRRAWLSSRPGPYVAAALAPRNAARGPRSDVARRADRQGDGRRRDSRSSRPRRLDRGDRGRARDGRRAARAAGIAGRFGLRADRRAEGDAGIITPQAGSQRLQLRRLPYLRRREAVHRWTSRHVRRRIHGAIQANTRGRERTAGDGAERYEIFWTIFPPGSPSSPRWIASLAGGAFMPTNLQLCMYARVRRISAATAELRD